MNSQQICKISRKVYLTEVKMFQNVLGGATFFKHHVVALKTCCADTPVQYVALPPELELAHRINFSIIVHIGKLTKGCWAEIASHTCGRYLHWPRVTHADHSQ